jgi:NodT family efflux transporter outer membrane factor (OMF) lipoprotein
MRTPRVRAAIGRIAAGVIAAAGVACATAPPYQTPVTTPPPAFKETPGPDSRLASEWKTAEPQDNRLRANWWETFGDPTLNALEEKVATANQTVAQADATFRAARAALKAAGADLYPTVTVSGTPTVSEASTTRAVGALSRGTVADYLAQSDVSYEPDFWGRVHGAVLAGAATAQATAADLQNTRLSLQSELAEDYVQLRGTDEQVRLLDVAIASYERFLQLTINKHAQGVVSGADVATARTQLESARVQATDLGISRAELEHAIAVLTGQPPADLSLDLSTLTLSPPVIPLALPSVLLERRPDIAGAERRVAAANAQIGIAHAAFFPTLTLSASGGFESQSLATLFDWPSRVWSLGAALAETVFDAGKRKAQTEEAVATYDATVATYRQTVLSAMQDVEDNLVTLRILAEETDQQAAALAAAEASLTIADNQYRAGITDYLAVITAQNVALTNERTSADLLTRRLTASVLLIKALGGGWSTRDLPQVR